MSRLVDIELFKVKLVFNKDRLFNKEGLDKDGLEGKELELIIIRPLEALKVKTTLLN